MIKREWLFYLSTLQGVGWKTLSQLMNLEQLDKISERNPLELSVETGISFSLAETILKQISIDSFKDAMNQQKKWEQQGIQLISYFDEDYPVLLKEINSPPWIIYAYGDIQLLTEFKIAVVGTRHPTPYGQAVCSAFTKDLASNGWVIVSGLAKGIDKIAHEAALTVGGKTIAVLGNGVDVIYPRENKAIYQQILQKGLLLSEFAPGVQPRPGFFPQRNRIISGLSHGTIVIEASLKSGSLITAKDALEQSREVFAVPGPITSKESTGTNLLIQQGAKLVQRLEDINNEFPYFITEKIKINNNHNNKSEETLSLHYNEKIIYNLISSIKPIHINHIIESVQFPISEVYENLLLLQIKSLIRQMPGNFYIRNS